jgi:hypothetical protein
VSTGTGFTHFSGQRIKTASSGPGGPPPPPPPPPPTPVTIDLSPAGAPNGSWFFAEGAASTTPGGFQTYYLIANVHDISVHLRAYFSRGDGWTTMKELVVAPRSRTTLSLIHVAGPGSFGAVFQALTPGADLFIERSMYWGPNWEGSTGEVASNLISTQWFFAEGSRGGELFHNYFLLYNPTQTPSAVNAFFALPNGSTVVRPFTIGAQQRLTIDANAIPELAGQAFSCAIYSYNAPIVAERAMYWGPGWSGGTAARGAIWGGGRWLFAEGAAAPGFDTFYLVYNLSDRPATLHARLMPELGPPVERWYTVPGRSRFTIYLNHEVGNIGGVAAEFNASEWVVVERSVYWGAGWVDGTSTVGSGGEALHWFLPEGTAGGAFDSFLLLANANATVGSTINIGVYVEGVGGFGLPYQVHLAPQSRKTLYMNQVLKEVEAHQGLPPGTLAGKSFSTQVWVVGGAPVVAEHSLYWRRDGANYWRAGSAAFGIPR